jgi:hypothetical protein
VPRQALDRLDESGANQALDRLLSGFSLETVLREIVMPYLRDLGDRWARGEVSAAQEQTRWPCTASVPDAKYAA